MPIIKIALHNDLKPSSTKNERGHKHNFNVRTNRQSSCMNDPTANTTLHCTKQVQICIAGSRGDTEIIQQEELRW